MKLYSITTSERASKGQGGNEFIETIITVEEKTILKVIINKRKATNGYCLIIEDKNKQEIYHKDIEIEKGKSQKGEQISCENHSYYKYGCEECEKLN